MIDHIELNKFIISIINLTSEQGHPPTITELAEKTFMSRGAVEHRLRYLWDMKLIKDTWRQSIHLEGETYIPPQWAGDANHLLERLPEKNRRLVRST